MDHKLEHLKLGTTGLFKDVQEGGLKEAYGLACIEKRGSGEFFFFQDDPADSTYVLVEGQVRLLQLTAEGQQVILNMIVPNTLFGVIAAVKGTTYPVTAEAAEDSRALCWSHEDLQTLMARYPQVAQNTMQLIAGHVQEFQNRFREMATERVERRLARAMLRLTSAAGKKTAQGIEITIPISRQDLAEMSGTTLFTVSRIISEWERRGLVHTGREHFVILQPHGLVTIAEDLPQK